MKICLEAQTDLTNSHSNCKISLMNVSFFYLDVLTSCIHHIRYSMINKAFGVEEVSKFLNRMDELILTLVLQ